jgi:FkbM family methyltransferase
MTGVRCVVVDAGARYGLHPTWADLRGVAEFHMFEMDKVEADRLAAKYKADANIRIYPVALYSSDTTLKFTVTEHQALNSVFETNSELLQQHDYMTRDFTPTAVREVEARSLDSLFRGQDVHFVKLDVEGAEYDVLQGSGDMLERSVLGLRAEVLFAEVYKGAALFGDLNKYMIDRGFELLNLDYNGAGNKAGRFTLPGRFGRLISSDAVWIVGNDRLHAQTGERKRDDILRMAVFLMNNNATDLAIDLMMRAVTREGVSFEAIKDDPLFKAFHKKAAYLFKALLSVPNMEEEDITSTYKTIFGLDFPLMNRFYESALFA